jgi:hypothetical protein
MDIILFIFIRIMSENEETVLKESHKKRELQIVFTLQVNGENVFISVRFYGGVKICIMETSKKNSLCIYPTQSRSGLDERFLEILHPYDLRAKGSFKGSLFY